MPPPPPPGTEPGLYDKYMPEALGGARGAVPPEVYQRAREAYTQEMAASGDRYLARMAMDEVIKKGTPGMLYTYGPLAAAGLAATAALGGFKEKPAAVPQMPDMMDPKYARPLQFGGIYGSRGYSNIPRMPVTAADGGIMALEMGGTTYPRKQGHIKGPGTGTSDSIPALLSDGEFVFTAKSVRNLGNGSRRKGAKRLYAMMKMLEERKV